MVRRAHVGAFGTTSSGSPSQRRYAFTPQGLGGSCGSISVMVPLPGWDERPISVDGTILEKSLKGMSGKLTLTLTDKVFQIKMGRTRVKLVPGPFESECYPEPAAGLTWTPVEPGFGDLIRACAFTNKTGYEGVACANVNDTKLLISTNEARIYYKEVPRDLPTFWLTTSSAMGVNDAGTEIVAVASDGMWVHFKYEDGTVFSTLTKDIKDYPIVELYNYIQSFNAGKEIANGQFPAEGLAAIKAAATFAEGTNGQKPVKLKYANGVLTIEAANKSGEYSQDIDWAGPQEPFAVAVDAVFMNAVKASEFRLVEIPDLSVMMVPGAVNALMALDNV